MEIQPGKTAPLSLPGQQSGVLPPELAAFVAQLPPNARQEMTALYRQNEALGTSGAAQGAPQEVLFANTEAGARVMKAYFEDLAKSAPTEKLATLFKQAAGAVMSVLDLRKMAAQMQVIAEQRKAAELLRMVLDEEAIRAKLRAIRNEDIQAAMDLLKQARQEQEAMQLTRTNAEQLIAAGLVVAVTAPVASRSKLEGVTNEKEGKRLTLTNAKADERLSAFDPLKSMQAMASKFKLDDFN